MTFFVPDAIINPDEMPGMHDNSCDFEPTFTLKGIPILPIGCQALIASGEGRREVAVTHLALLGVKKQEPAFWVKEWRAFVALYY